MKYPKTSLLIFISSILMWGALSFAETPDEAQLKQDVQTLGMAAVTAPDFKPGIIEHNVYFHYKDDVTSDQRAEAARRFLALQTLAQRNGRPYIISIVYGIQNSGEGANLGLQEGFRVTFKTQGDRNYYVGQPVIIDSAFYDPAHQAFKDFVGPLLNDTPGVVPVVVFDFCVKAMTSVGG